ncbi:MAG: immunoglobulin domain-containing protein, partial [Planctomycetota bacterium]
EAHPYNPNNNINGVDGDADNDNNGWELHTLDLPAITALQKAYVAKAIDTINDQDHIVWEISNESHDDSISWQYHMINYIKSYESAYKPKQHAVGMTGYCFNNSLLFASPADWISPNKDGGYRDNPPAATGNKIVVSDTDHLWGLGGDRAWVWKSFLRGLNPIFMDSYKDYRWGHPSVPDPTYDPVREACGHTRYYAEMMNLVNMTPQNSLCSTNYCLANPGTEYLAYQPGSGSFTVNLVSGTYAYEWYNCNTGAVAETGTVAAPGGNQSFTPPFSGMAALYLLFVGPRMPVLCDLNDPDYNDGLRHNQCGDGDTTPAAIGGRNCRTNVDTDNDKYMYFDIDYAYNGSLPEAYITIEYFDTGSTTGSGDLRLQYDANDGVYYKTAGTIPLTDTDTWMQHVFHITDAYFGDRQNCSSDFRINKTGGGGFYIDTVKVADMLPPTIAQHPSAVKLHKGQTAQFQITASGDGTLEYQWQRNGSDLTNGGNISGADSDTLTVTNVQSADVGNYRCVVSNNGGDDTSDEAGLTLAATGDFDVDDDIDQEDFGHFQACLSGTGIPQNDPSCIDARLDGDEDVDFDDFDIFAGCVTGPNGSIDPNCEN